jgi:IMP dehydrogenase
MKKTITFDDVLIEPKFSSLNSRKDVDVSTIVSSEYNLSLNLPIVAANMDTVCGELMAATLISLGATGCLHRFWSIEDNVKALTNVIQKTEHGVSPWVSVGISDSEKERALALIEAGAKVVTIDVAHAAQMQVVNFYRWLKQKHPEICLVVGNFGTGQSIKDFCYHLGFKIDVVKVGIGPGSACTTRIKTGCGVPQLSAIMDCVTTDIPIIADGGMRTPGDISKALAAGARMVMLGGMLAGTDETPGEVITRLTLESTEEVPGDVKHLLTERKKIYRGSASKESYEDQGKNWSCAEGETFSVPYRGSVVDIIKDIEGGLRSAFTYVGAKNLKDFQSKAEFVKVSPSVVIENGAHGSK